MAFPDWNGPIFNPSPFFPPFPSPLEGFFFVDFDVFSTSRSQGLCGGRYGVKLVRLWYYLIVSTNRFDTLD
jgi:hypothetical protein